MKLFSMKTLLYIWQLPQTILGWIIVRICGWDYRERKRYPNVHIYFSPKFRGGVSLGKYIILSTRHIGEDMDDKVARAHEYGHCIQSQILGWFYLPIVGLWSAIRSWFNLYKRGHYFDAFPENWADELGHVYHDENDNRYV